MIDDLDSNMVENNNIESTSDKFPMKKCQLPSTLQNINILCMSCSKKYIYIITNSGEIICLESDTLNPINESFTIDSSGFIGSKTFKENITKIWTDRAGNHNIIRYNNKIFYFNMLCKKVKELKQFKNIEICALGFDDGNKNPESTGFFLAADYNNNIYECQVLLEKKSSGEYKVKSGIKKLTTLVFDDWDTEEDEEYSEPKRKKYERIYGIKFFKNKKIAETLTLNDSVYYIICATKTKLYQFSGPGIKSFEKFFERFDENPMLFNDSCKYFPQIHKKNKIFTGSEIDLLYKKNENIVEQFGWKTETGFCFSNFNYYEFLPSEINNYIVVPFEKINHEGQKKKALEPLSVTHTQNHIFILYDDCLTIISKLTSNIIQTIYLQSDFTGLIYDEFAEKNGVILLYSKIGLYQISLNDENKDIWKDYLDAGDYSNAIKWVEGNNKLIRRINRIDAEEDFAKNDFNNSVMKYNLSDEHFEIVCLKYLLKNQLDLLQLYCELYLSDNVNINKVRNLEANVITTMIIERMVNNTKIDKNKSVENFRSYIRGNLKYLKEGNVIGSLLRSYGKMEEFILFCSIVADYETVIMYYINRGNIYEALDKLIGFASYIDEEDKNGYKLLCDIFIDNSHSFFKYNPKESINLIKQKLKDVSMEKVIQAIICTMDQEVSYIYQLGQSSISSLEIPKKEENYQTILRYLKSLIEKKETQEISNIHNLYIYYLVKGKRNQEALLEYLKRPLKVGDFSKKKKVLFQLDYAIKLFANNTSAMALVLALMGKYSEGVQKALSSGDKNGNKIAEFIASNAPGDSLKKQLWIEIFSYINKQHKFQEALNVMKNSKILKIEDVLPHITDTIKIEEFKKQISECIFDYEENIKKLKDDIDNYNKTSENIKNDIANLKKRSMEIPFTTYKCQICQNYIKNNDVYLFPCGHMFDANCIRKCLLDYEATGLEYIHDKNVKIDSLFIELGYTEKSNYDIIVSKEKTQAKVEEEKNQWEFQKGATNIFNKLKFRRVETVKDKGLQNNLKRKESELKLNKILSEQCILCGDYMVDSVQCSISMPKTQKVIDGTKIRIRNISNWDYYE